MKVTDPILLGKGESLQFLLPAYGNRHGLVTGATGTGKTVTLQILAEGFSRIGVPVFLADVKGDLAGLGSPSRRIRKSTNACRKSASPILRRPPGRWSSGTCSARAATRCARRYPRWGRCCWPTCWS
jgi:hypothetical protein